MKYAELVEYMRKYRGKRISRLDMVAAIALWQRGGARRT